MLLTGRIKSIITDKNITFASLERELNLGHGTIRKWDTSSPSSDKILKIAKYFNVSVDWLLTGEGEMYKQTTDIKPDISTSENLSLDKKLILSKYDELNDTEKLKFLDFITSGTFKVPRSKLYTSTDTSEDETTATYELKTV